MESEETSPTSAFWKYQGPLVLCFSSCQWCPPECVCRSRRVTLCACLIARRVTFIWWFEGENEILKYVYTVKCKFSMHLKDKRWDVKKFRLGGQKFVHSLLSRGGRCSSAALIQSSDSWPCVSDLLDSGFTCVKFSRTTQEDKNFCDSDYVYEGIALMLPSDWLEQEREIPRGKGQKGLRERIYLENHLCCQEVKLSNIGQMRVIFS